MIGGLFQERNMPKLRGKGRLEESSGAYFNEREDESKNSCGEYGISY